MDHDDRALDKYDYHNLMVDYKLIDIYDIGKLLMILKAYPLLDNKHWYNDVYHN
jgi:hypothetical protein